MKPRYYVNDVRWADEDIENTQNMDFYHPTTWEACDGENLRAFTAVGYHFGKMLREHLDVPIGLVCNAIGGAPAEAWIDRETLAAGYPEVLEDWFTNSLLNQWCIEMGKINIGYPETGATKHPYAPAYLFEAGIASMEQFPIKGVVWYQGESNDYNIPMHEKLFTLLVEGWRNNWNNPQMPFHFVQLSGLADRSNWPDFRDSQRRLAEVIPYCEMAVSSDVGDSLDIHPRQKRPVGERLARLSLRYDYGVDIVPCGPVLKEAVLSGNDVVLTFDFAEGLATADSQPVRCFEVAGEDEVFAPAEAVISDGKVVLTSNVEAPKFVRYAWQPFTNANLVNGDALPASTFRAAIAQ
jgi:sialate O-acetylesterase